MGGQRYALSTALVREVVEVTSITHVPRTDVAVLGLFNLRGEPMPLVDVAPLLGLPGAVRSPKMHVMILRDDDELSVGVRVDAIGAVVANSGTVPSADANPILSSFLPATGSEGPVAVIEPAEFLRRLGELRVRRTTADAAEIER